MTFETIDEYIAQVGGRQLAAGEWGLDVEGISIGLRAHQGLLRAQAWAVSAGVISPAELLHRNRTLELVRYASTKAGDVWVVGDVPLSADVPVDRLLGSLVEAVQAARLRERSR